MNKIRNTDKKQVLTINGGSSSIKFALYEIDTSLKPLLTGEMANIGTANVILSYHKGAHRSNNQVNVLIAKPNTATHWLISWLEK